jgi:hypothetical protein
MAKEHNAKDQVVAMDIAHSADIRKLAEDVERTGRSRSLRRGDEEIAKIVPVRNRAKAAKYSPARLRSALAAAGAAMAGMDPDAVIASIYRAREEGSRPATRP